jgi:hypothetical protein
MQTKQTAQETQQILDAIVESLKPARLVLINEARKDSALVPQMKLNVTLIDSWMQANCAKDDVCDYSFKNIRKAIGALKGQLSWIVPPVSRGSRSGVQTEGNKVSREISELVSTDKLIKAAEDRKIAEKDAEILRKVEALCKTHTNFPHSKSFKEREELQKAFKRLQAQKVKPVEIEKKIRAMIASFFPEKRQR